MKSLEEMEITHYMMLDQQIRSLHRKKITKRWEFYQQSFYTNTSYTGYEIVAQAIKPENGIERLDMIIEAIDAHIHILTLKKKYWCEFFESLTSKEQRYFWKKYVLGHVVNNVRLDKLAISEIEEIIVAISFQLGIRDEDTDHEPLIENDFLGNIDLLLERGEAI